MALGERPHHRGLAARSEGGAGFAGFLDGDQPVDDLAALHQQAVHRLVDAIDLLPQLGESRGGGVSSWRRAVRSDIGDVPHCGAFSQSSARPAKSRYSGELAIEARLAD